MFRISPRPLIPRKLAESMIHPKAGGFVAFEGWVRNHNHGQTVKALEYEVYPELAEKEAQLILSEAKEKFNIIDAHCVHREGILVVGEVAVWVGVSAEHRDSAFRACRYVIDQVKHRLPIWKKEFYLEGQTQWVRCHDAHKPRLFFQEKDYYQAQMNLPEMTTVGQDKLKNAKVLVIGAGGLGCAALTYLASSGVGQLTICDGDRLEVHNLHRQTLYGTTGLGENKAKLAVERLTHINPFISLKAMNERMQLHNIIPVVSEHDLVIDCTDNFTSQFLIHDVCFQQQRPLIQASIHQYEGQVRTYHPQSDQGCLRCLWPQLPETQGRKDCREVGVLGAVTGIVGSMQALEAIKYFLGIISPVSERLLTINLLTYQIERLQLPKNDQCPLCGEHGKMQVLTSEDYEKKLLPWELNIKSFQQRSLRDFQFIDIREPHERRVLSSWSTGMKHMPLSEQDRFDNLPKDKSIVFICAQGQRSLSLAKKLRKQGYSQVYSLAKGITTAEKLWESPAH